MARTVKDILNGSNINPKAMNCQITIDNDVDEVLTEFMIAFSEPDGSGNIISLTKIAPRSVYQYTIHGYCVSEIGATAHYSGEPLINFPVQNAGPNSCFVNVPYGIEYEGVVKVISDKSKTQIQKI